VASSKVAEKPKMIFSPKANRRVWTGAAYIGLGFDKNNLTRV